MKKIICLILGFLIYLFPAPLKGDTITLQVSEQNDDAEEDITGPNAGNVRRTSTDLEIGNENGVEQWVGLRFQGVDIPAGSTINSAEIRFTAVETDVGNLTIPIVAEVSLDPSSFRDVTPLTGRIYTLGAVDWNIDPWFPGDSGPNTTTPDLSLLVQEIVDQPGWMSGAPMVFILQNDPMDTSERLAMSWDGNPAEAATITIDFTPPSGIVDSFQIISGVGTAGALADLQVSDNSDLTVIRNPIQAAAKVELEFTGSSAIDVPTRFDFSMEASGFYRTPVIQSVSFFNYTTQAYEQIGATNTSRFTDSIFVVSGTGDLSRFVEPVTGEIRARVAFTSARPRQSFSAAVDHVFWDIE